MRDLTLRYLIPPNPSHAQVAPLMGKRVEIHGTSRADMNGKRGVATDFHLYPVDESKWRYTVKLDGGEAFKIKETSVRAEGACGVGGGGGTDAGKTKGKGKGKKRRSGRN